MAVYRLTRDLVFPPPEGASADGLVAVGGDTRPERLVLAYSQGIFPWPHQGLPLLWFSPDPRFVIRFEQRPGQPFTKAFHQVPDVLRGHPFTRGAGTHRSELAWSRIGVPRQPLGHLGIDQLERPGANAMVLGPHPVIGPPIGLEEVLQFNRKELLR